MASTVADHPCWPALHRTRRALVVADVVESVRLMQADEADVIQRWRCLVNDVRQHLLPAHGGRLVKSLGDGMLIEFEAVDSAVSAALALSDCTARVNAGHAPQAWIRLRTGVHVGEVVSDELDIYGQDVNIAQRLTTLARPDDIVVSAAVADRLVPGLDADIEDMGACHLKHLREPVHAFRLRRAGEAVQPARMPPMLEESLLPRIAVVPFSGCAVSALESTLGDAIADSVIVRLSANSRLRVISRLSTAVMRARAKSVVEIGQLLHVAYVLSGTFALEGQRLRLRAELADARTDEVVWVREHACDAAEMLQPESPAANELARQVADAVSAGEMRRVRALPIPSLEGFSMLLGAMMLMHRASAADFERAGELLEHLMERFPRAAEPRAWMAKWYVLRVSRGVVRDMDHEASLALDHIRHALDESPDCSMALAAEGFVHCHMRRDLDTADRRLDEALRVNPSDPLAWIFRCAVKSFRGLGEEAMACGEHAVSLSPLDPMRHYYDALASTAALSAGRLERAIELATRSLRANRHHLPTLRTLAIAQAEHGDFDGARATVRRVLEIEPTFTISRYLERTPRGGETPRQRYASALKEAGVPMT
ncbi:adenylate/guanylate cyclase domain-containing protein [Ideonella sp. YS5]|uniref:adenylate/guanylate cyclase domain-containing protein n=1 Tax=Ideonella sp. YS5 TaxID=3453714 RepID=UPI003EEB01DE